MLNAMATTYKKDGKDLFLLHLKSGSFLRCFADELLAFREATER